MMTEISNRRVIVVGTMNMVLINRKGMQQVAKKWTQAEDSLSLKKLALASESRTINRYQLMVKTPLREAIGTEEFKAGIQASLMIKIKRIMRKFSKLYQMIKTVLTVAKSKEAIVASLLLPLVEDLA